MTATRQCHDYIEWTGNIRVHHRRPEPQPDRSTAMTRKVTDAEARQAIAAKCRQFIEDEPARGESFLDTERRTAQLEWDISAAIGASIRPGSLEDVLTTLAEVQSVETGTHPDVVRNAALTTNTAPDVLDRLNNQLREELYFVIQSAEGFIPGRVRVA